MTIGIVMTMRSLSGWDLFARFDQVAAALTANDVSGITRSEHSAEQAAGSSPKQGTMAVAVQRCQAWMGALAPDSRPPSLVDIAAARSRLIEWLSPESRLTDAKLSALPELARAFVDALLNLPADKERTHQVVFWLNGQKQVVHNPDPRTLLLDYLRSPAVGMIKRRFALRVDVVLAP